MTNAVDTINLSHGRLATIVASRFVLNAIFRVAYPLVPFLAARFGVSDAQATWIVTIQVLLGLFSVLGGWLGERIGYRTTMVSGATIVLLGALGVAVAPTLALLIAAYGLCGFGIAVYQPAMQAYVSELTPYHQRGRAVGVVELSWALAGMLAVPPLMWLIEAQQSVTGAFSVLAGSLAAATITMLVTLPNPAPERQAQAVNESAVFTTLRNSNVAAMLAFIFLALGGVELIFVVQAPWATERFNASLPDLGIASLVFGFGELGGSSASMLFTDRLGKRRAATLGFALAAVVYVLLPWLSVNWLIYLLCFFSFALFAEFGIVAALTFASTVSLTNRATVMALTIMAIQLSRVFASRLGVPLLNATSLVMNGLGAALLTALGIAIALRYASETERPAAHVAA